MQNYYSMNTKYLFFYICFTICAFQCSYAQKNKYNDEQKKILKQLILKYPNNKEICINANTEFSFYSKDQQLNVKETTNEELITTSYSNGFIKQLYYDDNSSISNFKLRKNGFDMYIEPKHADAIEASTFYNDLKVMSVETNFTDKGQNFSYSYNKTFNDSKYFTCIYFNDHYPIIDKEIIIKIPKWLNLEIIEMNFDKCNITKSETETKKEKIIKYKASSLAPIIYENYFPGTAKSYAHLIILTKSFTKKDVDYKLIATTKDLYQWYHSLTTSIENESEKLEPIVNKLISNCNTDVEKVSKLFYWVQDNIRYLAFENGIMGFKPEGAYKVYYNKYGDCKGMANLLKTMLIIAKIDARLCWIGTNILPYNYSIPSLIVDNHMICAVNLKDERLFLDPTEKYIAIRKYANRIQDKQVMIENNENFILDTIPKMNEDNELCVKSYICEFNDDKLKVEAKAILNGETKTNLIINYYSTNNANKEKQLKEKIINYNKNIQIDYFKHANIDDREKQLEIVYNFMISNKTIKKDSLLYVNIEFDKDLVDIKIDSTRINDLEFDYRLYNITNTKLNIPNSYTITYLPANVYIENDKYLFKLEYKLKDNILEYNKEIKFKDITINKKDFINWNTDITTLNKFYNDHIILKKR